MLFRYHGQWKSFPYDNPILVSHNAKSFDSVVFMNSVSKTGVKFENIVGFVDTLPHFKDLLPGKKSHSQSSLVHMMLVFI